MNERQEPSKEREWSHGGKRVFLSSFFFIKILGIRKREMEDERFEKGWVGRLQ